MGNREGEAPAEPRFGRAKAVKAEKRLLPVIVSERSESNDLHARRSKSAFPGRGGFAAAIG